MTEIIVDDGGYTYRARLATPQQAAHFDALEIARATQAARTEAAKVPQDARNTNEPGSATLYEGTPIKPAAAAALQALTMALAADDPACLDDERFIADGLKAAQRAELARICTRCPVRPPCVAYAAAAKPTGGYWPAVEHHPSVSDGRGLAAGAEESDR